MPITPHQTNIPATSATTATSVNVPDEATQLLRLKIKSDRQAWAAAAPRGQGEDRNLALIKVESCENYQAELLELSYLDLSSVPPHIPPHITRLYLDGNRLESMAEVVLPEGLQVLSVANNDNLRALPALPGQLVTLHATGCRLSALPPDLPSTLQYLMVSRNLNLTITDADRLPESLRTLRLSNCNLTNLPEYFLPPFLEVLVLDHNLLRRLPENLPRHIEQLMVHRNQLSSLPESLASLPGSTFVDISGNPLSVRTRAAIERIASDDNWAGPRIHFAVDHASDTTPQRSVEEMMAIIYPHEQSYQMAEAWSPFESAAGADQFLQFLSRLTYTGNINDAEFVESIGQWLQRLIDTPDLREQMFLLADEASQSCDDRILLVLNDMENACIVHAIEHGHYDEKLSTLMRLGREIFRKECLQSIAKEKVNSLNFVDEIEVYLAYQVKLRDPLQLGSTVRQMSYFSVSYVTQEDLDLAIVRVQQRERNEYRTWLANWAPWNTVLQRLDPEAYTQMQQSIEAEDVFHSRLSEQLSAENIVPSLEAETVMGSIVAQQMTIEAKSGLTERFLEARGLSALLASPWENAPS